MRAIALQPVRRTIPPGTSEGAIKQAADAERHQAQAEGGADAHRRDERQIRAKLKGRGNHGRAPLSLLIMIVLAEQRISSNVGGVSGRPRRCA